MRLFRQFPSLLAAIAMIALSGCADRIGPPASGSLIAAPEFRALTGWPDDDHAAALPALRQSCDWFGRRDPNRPIDYGTVAGTVGDWSPFCAELAALQSPGPAAVRRIVERHLVPVPVDTDTGGIGLFTGYYAPELRGNWQRTPEFATPLYRLPNRRRGQTLPSRAQIARGVLAGRGLELLWVDDPVDAFFLEIQGSGHVRLPDGQVVGVGYHGQNGHRYFPIGRALIDRGIATREDMSMSLIRDWLRTNQREAQALMNLNPSYIFFQLRDDAEIRGAMTVPLTPGRSLAVDLDHIPLGVPLWLDIQHPTVPGGTLRRLVVAQDTGGAIRGRVAGDLYWGVGPEAARLAGPMQAAGRYALLVPRGTIAGQLAGTR